VGELVARLEAGDVAIAEADRPRVGLLEAGEERSSVDLPHPLGPTSTANAPSATDRETPLRTRVSPNCLPSSVTVTPGGSSWPSSSCCWPR